METKNNAKDFFINFGAIVALYAGVISLVSLLFTAINTAYPKVSAGYSYFGSSSISWPVAAVIIFFPIFLLLMWLLEKEYRINPEKQYSGIHRWLTYITLFLSGFTVAMDLITILYYFIDGQELTTGFILKVIVLLIIASSIFIYFISDLRGKLTAKSRIFWRVFAGIIVIGSIIWGFSVLGSPHTQRLYKYDQQKVMGLQNMSNKVTSFYSMKGYLPKDEAELNSYENYYIEPSDAESNSYEYIKTSETTYNLCAEFNKASNERNYRNNIYEAYPYDGMNNSWTHPAGKYCFTRTINPNMYAKPLPSLR